MADKKISELPKLSEVKDDAMFVVQFNSTAYHLTGKQLKEYAAGGGAAVQTDWLQSDASQPDFLKNKPFGEQHYDSVTLTWDGNPDGKEAIQMDAATVLCKVSDTPLPYDALLGGTLVYFDGVEERKEVIRQGYIHPLQVGDVVCLCALMVYSFPETVTISEDGVAYTFTPGVYFLKGTSEEGAVTYVKSFTNVECDIVKKVSEKYLPDRVVLKSTTEDSEKRFEITVDDSGSLSATEITE